MELFGGKKEETGTKPRCISRGRFLSECAPYNQSSEGTERHTVMTRTAHTDVQFYHCFLIFLFQVLSCHRTISRF